MYNKNMFNEEKVYLGVNPIIAILGQPGGHLARAHH